MTEDIRNNTLPRKICGGLASWKTLDSIPSHFSPIRSGIATIPRKTSNRSPRNNPFNRYNNSRRSLHVNSTQQMCKNEIDDKNDDVEENYSFDFEEDPTLNDNFDGLPGIERKRQEVMSELIRTEVSHVQALLIITRGFRNRLKTYEILPEDKLQKIFGNVEELLQVHTKFKAALSIRKLTEPIVKRIGDILLEMFDGENGEQFEQVAYTYCSRQLLGLEKLKKSRKDSAVDKFLTELEATSFCKRLQLKDYLVFEMQRITKYPLLLENLLKSTSEEDVQEREDISKCLNRSKEILQIINASLQQPSRTSTLRRGFQCLRRISGNAAAAVFK